MNIPTTSTEFTTDWLTTALRTTSTITHAAVTKCEVQPLTTLNDLTSQQVRLCLTYDRTEGEAPRTLIAKFSAADPEMRKNWQGHYAREVNFYQQVAPHVALRVPRCYYSALDGASGAHVLLLEDLAPAASPGWEEGCTLAQTAEAIRQIACLHADWWDNPRLSEMGVGQPNQDYLHHGQERYQTHAWAAFAAKVGDQIPGALRELGRGLGEYYVKVFTYLQQPPVTLAHFDYKPSNLFFATNQGGAPFAVANWQLNMRHRGVFDVAYLLSGGVKSEVRRQKEQEWLSLYHATLCEKGVRGYTLDQCRFDYRLSLLRRFMRFVIWIGGGGNFDLEQKQLIHQILLPRTCSAMLDFDVPAVLAELDSISVGEGASHA
ncbi:MAG: DUF1679 domain-containing protein [Caldilineaceae bacterium]|nr:DUF1679 domain-containing protein [Caldilineaceae bacterium]